MVQKPHPGEAGGATGGISWGTLDVESYQVFLEIEVRSYELPILSLIDLNHSDDAPEQRSKKDTAFCEPPVQLAMVVMGVPTIGQDAHET